MKGATDWGLPMECPKCAARMERVKHQGIEVDRCTECKGLWFDYLEKDTMRQAGGAEAVDTGSAVKGKRFDPIREVDCPRCNTRMHTVTDSHQSHIDYEACPSCEGTFFDAGEYRDLADFTLIERVIERFKPQSS